MPDTSTLIIEEIGVKAPRRVELNGPALPKKGASWKTAMQLVTTWYPGNPVEATQQVLGAREQTSQWEGMWKRTQMGACPSIYNDGQGGGDVKVTTPSYLRDAIDAIFVGGARLRVTWAVVATGNKRYRIVREGRAKTWEFPHDTIHDIEWKFEFEWVGRGGAIQKVIATRDGDLDSAMASLQSAMNDLSTYSKTSKLKQARPRVKNSAHSLTLGQLEALANYPHQVLTGLERSFQQQMNYLQRVSDLAHKIKNLPASLRNSAEAFAQNMQAVYHQTIDKWSRTSPELNSARTRESDITRAQTHFGTRAEQSAVIARRAQELKEQIGKSKSAVDSARSATSTRSSSKLKPESVIAVHVAKSGETIPLLSAYYYGSSDHAYDICKANRLPYYQVQVRKGTILIIPVLGSQGLQI